MTGRSVCVSSVSGVIASVDGAMHAATHICVSRVNPDLILQWQTHRGIAYHRQGGRHQSNWCARPCIWYSACSNARHVLNCQRDCKISVCFQGQCVLTIAYGAVPAIMLGMLCLQAALALAQLDHKLVGPAISDDRIYDCVNVMLSFQNGDGGWSTYENTRSYPWLEVSKCLPLVVADTWMHCVRREHL